MNMDPEEIQCLRENLESESQEIPAFPGTKNEGFDMVNFLFIELYKYIAFRKRLNR